MKPLKKIDIFIRLGKIKKRAMSIPFASLEFKALSKRIVNMQNILNKYKHNDNNLTD